MIITEQEIDRHINGWCGSLAMAIADVVMTERGELWDLVVYTDEPDTAANGHVMVRRPDGVLIDVLGTHTDAELLADYPTMALVTVSEDHVRECGWPLEDTEDLARRVLAATESI